jgi:hypothetical protein
VYRLLLAGQLVSLVLIGILACIVLRASPPAPASPAGGEAGASAAAPAPEMQVGIAELRQQQEDLQRRLLEVEDELYSLDVAFDDVQGTALKNSLALQRVGGAGSESGDDPSLAPGEVQTLGVGLDVEPALEVAPSGEMLVDPVFDAAVRYVLDSVEEERRQDREARSVERRQEMLRRLAERFQLTDGQLAVVQSSYHDRLAVFQDLRTGLRAGQMSGEQARQLARDAQARYRAELEAVLTPEQLKGVMRSLDRRSNDARGLLPTRRQPRSRSTERGERQDGRPRQPDRQRQGQRP